VLQGREKRLEHAHLAPPMLERVLAVRKGTGVGGVLPLTKNRA